MVYGVSIVACVVESFVLHTPWLGAAAVLIVLADMGFGMLAVERFNEGKVPSAGRQSAVAVLVVALSMVTAYLTAGSRATVTAQGPSPAGAR